jgi:hypothetical protein
MSFDLRRMPSSRRSMILRTQTDELVIGVGVEPSNLLRVTASP